MKVIDAGHNYELEVYDTSPEDYAAPIKLRFMKRIGDNYHHGN